MTTPAPTLIMLFLLTFPAFAATPAKEAPPVPAEPTNPADEELLGAQKPKFIFKGQYKNLYTFQHLKYYHGDSLFTTERKNAFTDVKRLRLSPEFQYGDTLIIRVDFDNELLLSSYNKSYEFDAFWRPSDYNDFFPLSWEPYYSKDILYRTKIHRAYIKYNNDFFSFTYGRQQIRFGSGRLWNPLDILNPVSPTFVEGAEDQKGTDALIMSFFIKGMTEISLIYDQKLWNDRYRDIRAEGSNYLARVKTTFGSTDVALMGGWVSMRGVVGADVAAVVLDGLLRGSVMFHYPRDYGWFFQASAGYEYTFKEGVYLLVEYFYNGCGMNFVGAIRNAYAGSLFAGMNQKRYELLSNQILTMNQHYLGIAAGYDITPLLRIDLFTIFDFQGYGMFLTPALKFNAMENLDLNAGVMFGFIFDDSPHTSDFKAMEEQYLYYFSFTYYF